MSTEFAGIQTLTQKYVDTDARRADLRRFLTFGSFTVDLKREELFKDGSRIKLPGKVYQTLVALLERPGEVVSRDDLRIKLWPEGTHVNYDANVNTTVNKFRLALGDSPDKPIYVETIPRQGYSFVGTVTAGLAHGRNGNARGLELVEVNPFNTDSLTTDDSQARGTHWFVAGIVALVLAGALFGAATVMYLHRSV